MTLFHRRYDNVILLWQCGFDLITMTLSLWAVLVVGFFL
jgi:hypothetical protein